MDVDVPRRRVSRACGCDCGGWTAGGEFLPGHDARYRGDLLRVARWEASYAGGQQMTSREAADELARRGWLPNQLQRNQDARDRRIREAAQRYAPLIRDRHSTPTEPETPPVPFDIAALDWATRTYGVEIEFFGCTPETVEAKARELHAGVLDVRFESYNHHARSYWKIVTDQSVATSISAAARATGLRSGLELVSPILHGESGLREIERACEVLAAAGAKVDRSCGLHVHHGARDLPLPTLARVGLLYHAAQSAIDSILPASRRSAENPVYCQPIPDHTLPGLRTVQNRSDLMWALGSRYRVINFESLQRHGTVEFRQHSGTVEYPKIAAWVRLTQAMLRYAVEQEELPTLLVLEELLQILELDRDTRAFYRERHAELARPRPARSSRRSVRVEGTRGARLLDEPDLATAPVAADAEAVSRTLEAVGLSERFRDRVLAHTVPRDPAEAPPLTIALVEEARRQILAGTAPRDPAHAVPPDPNWAAPSWGVIITDEEDGEG